MTYSDEELYNLVADKMRISEMAFSVLYDRHSPQIWAFCLRFLGNETVAKDVFQETFLRFYNSIDGSRAINNLPGYILKIARNLCINQLNSTATFDAIPFDDDEFFAQTRQNDSAELLDVIKNSVANLSDSYREVFIMREYQGLAYQEIADITGDTLTNVKVKIHGAKDKIREILAVYIEDLQKHDIKI